MEESVFFPGRAFFIVMGKTGKEEWLSSLRRPHISKV